MTGQLDTFKAAYRALNSEQKKAVDKLDGPLLVLAGPGTGKTQLLTTRVGRILEETDAAPENILCLTFSDAAVVAMKNRLTNLIGPSARDITVSTYHSFGRELINTYADLFQLPIDIQPGDDLILDKLLREILSELDYSNPLKDDFYVGDIKTLISGLKKALITPDSFKLICDLNEDFMSKATLIVNELIDPYSKISKKQIPRFEELLQESHGLPGGTIANTMPLKSLWLEELEKAIDAYKESSAMTPLSKWKSRWLEKDRANKFVVKSPRLIKRQRAVVEIFNLYEAELKKRKLYDYDDMILLAIEGLDANPDIKFTLQERYMYLQLDEFQDTNEAQLKLIELLADSPVNEQRPNILAVGDDDQAIYSFQGAHYSHMQRFQSLYRDVELISLKVNYRSTPGIIELGSGIRNQIKEAIAPDSKTQTSASPEAKGQTLRVELPLDIEHLSWAATYIADLIKNGTQPSDIAVLAPKHRLISSFVPYLHSHGIAVSYTQRDSILDDPLISQLITCSRLVLALPKNNSLANSLWPLVLSQDHWQLPASEIWKLSWIANGSNRPWTEIMLDNAHSRQIALFFIRLSQRAEDTTFEHILSYLIGNTTIEINEPDLKTYTSPLFEYYFSDLVKGGETIKADQWNLLGRLSILNARAIASSDSSLSLKEFINFVDDNQNAGLKILDSTPFRESMEAVNLMTAYSSKGQEFNTVVLLDCVDNQWGRTSKEQQNLIGLSPNLKHVRFDSKNDDDKLRLLYVATSRAKRRLILASYRDTISGKPAQSLSYLNEHIEDDRLISPLFPANSQEVLLPSPADTIPVINSLPTWSIKHLDVLDPKRQALLNDRLAILGLTATNLNTYTNVIDNGPIQFYLNELLRFPKMQTPRSQYGIAVHSTLDWEFKQTKLGKSPTQNQIEDQFEKFLMQRKLPKLDFDQLLRKGKGSLKAYFSQTKVRTGEYDLSEEAFNAMLGNARLKGKIDRLIINNKDKSIHIIDFKTGKTYSKWDNKAKTFHHKRQLYFYKILVELTPKFRGYTVEGATLQFVEPDEDDGEIHSIGLTFEESESERLKQLISAVWDKVMSLDFPETEGQFTKDTKGILAFEDSLLRSK